MKISLIQPGRNNLKYLKWSYDSIRKNQGEHEVEICVADDASTDGTWDWCLEMMSKDPLFKAHCNEGPDRLGHTILYDTLINEVATKDIAMIYHADMYLCPGALDAIEREIEEGVIVSLTRIEPPLHPDGPEKILLNCGVEPEEFKEEVVLDWVSKYSDTDKLTEGIFAPWAFYVKEFQAIGGHDPLYAPQSKEDSDIFNRFLLNGIKFKQVWDGFVYHMTCRGSRRNVKDKAKNIYEDSPEWLAQNQRSTRNFIRKWGHFVKHDSLMKPIVPNKYNVGFWVHNCNQTLLHALEPWCDFINVLEISDKEVKDYIEKEQPNTRIPIADKINTYKEVDVFVKIDSKTFTSDDYNIIQQLSEILDDSGAIGAFELGNLFINIREYRTYTQKLINL
jgi:glycosyltransferase involved in cell wall biosynthesis